MRNASTLALALAVLITSLLILLPSRPPVRAEKAASITTSIDTNLLTLQYGYNLTAILPNGI